MVQILPRIVWKNGTTDVTRRIFRKTIKVKLSFYYIVELATIVINTQKPLWEKIYGVYHEFCHHIFMKWINIPSIAEPLNDFIDFIDFYIWYRRNVKLGRYDHKT